MTTATVLRVTTVSGPLKKPVVVRNPLPTTVSQLLEPFAPFKMDGIIIATPQQLFARLGSNVKAYEDLANRLKMEDERIKREHLLWDAQLRGPISHYLSFEAPHALAGSSFTIRTADTNSIVNVYIQHVGSDRSIHGLLFIL